MSYCLLDFDSMKLKRLMSLYLGLGMHVVVYNCITELYIINLQFIKQKW